MLMHIPATQEKVVHIGTFCNRRKDSGKEPGNLPVTFFGFPWLFYQNVNEFEADFTSSRNGDNETNDITKRLSMKCVSSVIYVGHFWHQLQSQPTFITSSRSSSHRTKTLLPADSGSDVDNVTASWASLRALAALLTSPAALTLVS